MKAGERSTHGLPTLFYRNGYLLTASILVLLVGGLSSLIALPRLEDPRITTRNVIVVTPVPGFSAERVDTLVTEVIEEELQEIPEILHIESTSKAGSSVTSIELVASVDESNNKEIFSEIRSKLDEAALRLPPEALPSRFDDQRGAVGFTLIVAFSWDSAGEPSLGILSRLAEDLADQLRALPGTEIVRVYGEPEEQITVELDPALMADLGLDAAAVAGRLATGDAKGAAGVLRAERADVLLELEGELDSLDRIASVPLLGGAAGELVRVGDVAEVLREARTPPSEIALVDGRRSVLVAARMETRVRVDLWAEEAREILADFTARLGPQSGVIVDPIFEQERYTSAQLSSLSQNLLAGALVVIAVIFILMGWRLALIVGLALPLVVSSVFLGWQLSGNAMHQMSIFGLIIALGLLIDNAIVVGDEVAKEKAAGRSGLEAVDNAVRHLAVPLASSTLTTVLAFAPILLLPGNIGDFVGSIGESVILAVVASYVLALTVTAALAGRFAQVPRAGRKHFWRTGVSSERLTRVARTWLGRAYRRPVAAILVALFLPMAGFVVARSLGNEFFPPVDRDLFEVQMWMANESSIEATRERAGAVEELIRQVPGAERVFWLVGGSFPTVYYNLVMDRDDSPEYAQAIVQAESAAAAKAMIDDLQASFDRRFPDAQLVVRQFGQGPPIQADVEYYLYGPELERLQDLGERLRLELQSHPQVLVSRTSLPRGEPKLWLDADEDEARLAGFSLRAVAEQLRGGLDGGVGGSVVEGLERLPVRVRWAERGDLARVASTPLVRPSGGSSGGGPSEWVPLEALGGLELRPEIGSITRYDGERTERIQAWTSNDALPIDVTKTVLASLEESGFELPPGYRLELGGAAAEDKSAKEALFAYVPVLVTLMIATLVLSFGSVRLAGLLLMIAGLSLGLAMLATWTIGFPISFNTMLGTLGLLGVALNDSIVVLAAIRASPDARAGDVDAVVREVLGTMRHVISTTLTTIGGFLPLLLFVGGDFWPSLAIVLAGGIGGGSILAVLFIPAAYVLLFRRRRSEESSTARLAFGTALLLLAGCTVGPDYVRPAPETLPGIDAETFHSEPEPTAEPGGEEAPAPDAAWWQAVGDETLAELVELALEQNLDLEAADARVRRARAARRVVAAGGRPTVGTEASGSRARASESTPEGALANAGLSELTQNRYGTFLSASWEVDLFGGVRRAGEAADARIGEAVEAVHGVRLGLIAELARTYVELRGAQRRLALAEKNVDLQRETSRRVEDLHRVGLGSKLDMERAKALLAGTRSRLAPLRAEIRAAAHRLAVLTGQSPGTLLDRLLDEAPLADPPDIVPVGLPSELLRRRPDLRAAERRLAASTADVGVATAKLYPRFFLTGAGGFESTKFSDLFESMSRTWRLGPSITWPIFQGGRLRAGVDAAEAARDEAWAEYRHSVLRAVEDVETALVYYAEEELRRRALVEAEAASLEAVRLAQVVYDKGLESYLTVLDAERTLVDVQDQLARSETGVLQRLVALYAALGGGWDVSSS